MIRRELKTIQTRQIDLISSHFISDLLLNPLLSPEILTPTAETLLSLDQSLRLLARLRSWRWSIDLPTLASQQLENLSRPITQLSSMRHQVREAISRPRPGFWLETANSCLDSSLDLDGLASTWHEPCPMGQALHLQSHINLLRGVLVSQWVCTRWVALSSFLYICAVRLPWTWPCLFCLLALTRTTSLF